MGRILLRNANLIDPEGSGPIPLGWLLIEGGRIAEHGEGVPPSSIESHSVDLEGLWLAPGLIDLHFHGDLSEARGDRIGPALEATARALLKRGTTAFLATSVAMSPAELVDFVTRVGAMTRHDARAICLGTHLEGPWIHRDRAGAHPQSAVRPYDSHEGRELLARADGTLGMITLAPEIDGGLAAIEEFRDAGVVVAIGHSHAEPPCIDDAVARGLTHVTHLFNAMTQPHHRDLGVAGCALTDDRLTADLICDGVHVDPRMVRLASRAKRERLSLISDQVGRRLGGQDLERDGCVWRSSDGALAGSAISLDQSLACFQTYTGVGLRQAVAAATSRPARVLGLEAQRGTLRPGARADLVVLDAGLRLRATWLAGVRVHAGR